MCSPTTSTLTGPPRTAPIDPGRPVVSAILLEIHLERTERYGAITGDAGEEARFFLRTLDEGYRFTFTPSVLIFRFRRSRTQSCWRSRAGSSFIGSA